MQCSQTLNLFQRSLLSLSKMRQSVAKQTMPSPRFFSPHTETAYYTLEQNVHHAMYTMYVKARHCTCMSFVPKFKSVQRMNVLLYVLSIQCIDRFYLKLVYGVKKN